MLQIAPDRRRIKQTIPRPLLKADEGEEEREVQILRFRRIDLRRTLQCATERDRFARRECGNGDEGYNLFAASNGACLHRDTSGGERAINESSGDQSASVTFDAIECARSLCSLLLLR